MIEKKGDGRVECSAVQCRERWTVVESSTKFQDECVCTVACIVASGTTGPLACEWRREMQPARSSRCFGRNGQG